MAEKYLMFSLDDDKARKLGEVISNPTAKKITNLLAEKEASESDIAKELNLPLNTIEYNLKNLLEAGLIEKAKNYFWSSRGKKISTYKIANKLIIISPKKTTRSIYSKLGSIVPVIIISAILTALIGFYYQSNLSQTEQISDKVYSASMPLASEAAPSAAAPAVNNCFYGTIAPIWPWFLGGALAAILAFLIWNWKKL